MAIGGDCGIRAIGSMFEAFTDLESDELLGDTKRRRRVFLEDFSGHVWFVL